MATSPVVLGQTRIPPPRNGRQLSLWVTIRQPASQHGGFHNPLISDKKLLHWEKRAGSPTVPGYLGSIWENLLLKSKQGSWLHSVRFKISYCHITKFYCAYSWLYIQSSMEIPTHLTPINCSVIQNKNNTQPEERRTCKTTDTCNTADDAVTSTWTHFEIRSIKCQKTVVNFHWTLY
jgi:hypothetical protein